MNGPAFLARLITAWWPQAVCALLLTAMALNMLAVIDRKNFTDDEGVLITAGYYYVAKGNVQLEPEHPPLAKIIAALPLLFLNLRTIEPSETGALPNSPYSSTDYLVERFWEDNLAAFESIGFWARVPAILLTVALGGLIFAFAREFFGATAGVLAVALFSLEPTVLAHGRVAGTDVPAAFGYVILFYFLNRYASASTWQRAAELGIAAGVTCLTKFSMLLAGPVLAVAFLLMIWRVPRRRYPRLMIAGQAGLAAFACIIVINAAYFFHHSQLFLNSDVELITRAFSSYPSAARAAVTALLNVLPTEFLTGAIQQLRHNKEGHTASLLGMYSYTGWRYYFPVAFALKVPLPFLLLSVVSLGWCGYMVLVKSDRRCFLLLTAFMVYFVMCMLTQINIGIRYFIPAYPFLFIMGGALLDLLIRSQRARATGMATAAGLLIWMSVEAVCAFPDYISYMNQLTAGRPHWQFLSDSNVEWGDDAKGLAEYLHARGETRVQGALVGADWLHFYGITIVDLNSGDAGYPLSKTRYVALGASFLNGASVANVIRGKTLTEAERVNFFDAYRRQNSETIIGGSIYVFRNDE